MSAAALLAAATPSELGLDLWQVLSGAGVVVVIAVVILLLRAKSGPRAGAPSKGGSLEQLARGLAKTRDRFGLALKRALGRELTEDALDELETAMLEADMGVKASSDMLEDLKQAFRDKRARTHTELLALLKDDLEAQLTRKGTELAKAGSPPTVILVVGVNGVGKTTSIAKMAHLLRGRGEKVLLCAADTFRAAAVEQLTIWAERTGAGIIKGATGADPASVVHDAVDAAVARGVDYLIVDTAGRLHTAKNLMSELGKIKRVIQRRLPEAPHEVILVLDATLGQNAIAQARTFQEVTDVTGLFLTKLDGTAKGGVVVAIHKELDLPVKLIGIGEKQEDVQAFDARRFAEALFG